MSDEEKLRAMLGFLLTLSPRVERVGECMVTVTDVPRGNPQPPRVPTIPLNELFIVTAAANARRFTRPDTSLKAATINCTLEAVRAASPGPGILHPIPGKIIMQVDGSTQEINKEEAEARIRAALINMKSYTAVSVVDIDEELGRGAAVLISPSPVRLILKGAIKERGSIMEWIRPIMRWFHE
ncbi:MAG: hypothetical protein ACP5NY_04165 [Thermocladium sp.]